MRYAVLIVLLLLTSCNQPITSPLEKALGSNHSVIKKVMAYPELFQVQIIYTQIDTNAAGETVFTDYQYQLNDSVYFYPASNVKLPAAVLALEFLDRQPKLTVDTPYKINNDTATYSVREDIREIFAISSNQPYDRLYELLGRDYMNKQLRSKEIAPVRISHRLWRGSGDPYTTTADSLNFLDQRASVVFYSGNDTLYHGFGTDRPIENLSIRNQLKGKAYKENAVFVEGPKDFSKMNYFPLRTQHELMKRLFFPNAFSPSQRFQISEENSALLFHHMSAVPRENGYDESKYRDNYGKFFLYGDDTYKRITPDFKIYNKVGYAYGTLTETAFITNEKTGVQFFLSATIYTNENNIINDRRYQYRKTGKPFLAQLGREIYWLEQMRHRK